MYRKDLQAREGRQQRNVRRRGVESIQRIRHPDTLAALLDNFARCAQWNIRCNSYRVPSRRAAPRTRADEVKSNRLLAIYLCEQELRPEPFASNET
jgi:hypothetical protein